MSSSISSVHQDQKTRRLRVLSHVVVGYMLLAFLWWAILLINKNDETFAAKQQLIASQNVGQAAYTIEELTQEHQRQKTMIIGEGLVFVIALFFGVWFINRGYTKEIEIIRQKKNFLLAITHELKSPLASIRLIFETFKKRNLEAQDQENLTTHGMQETDRLAKLVNNLLLSARLDKSYVPLMEKHDIRTLIEQVVTDLRKSHPDAELQMHMPDTPADVMLDVTGMYSMLYNLIENGIKYGRKRPIQVSVQEHPLNIEIQVADQGIGVPPAERAKIFEQFYRSGHEDTRQEKGTGIGLYIVSKISKLHGGHIRVMENTPKGTIFTATLPKAK